MNRYVCVSGVGGCRHVNRYVCVSVLEGVDM